VTSFARHERTLLAAFAQQLGPDAPTLCGDWTVKELLAHLVIREGRPSSAAIFVPQLAGWLDRATRDQLARPHVDLVDDVRHGPPLWSPFRLPKVDALGNLVEYFVHHEDIRRAQPDWAPRDLSPARQDTLWRALGVAGRMLGLRSPVPLRVVRSDTGAEMTLKRGEGAVLTGLPSEVLLFLYGRQDHAHVEVTGNTAAVAQVRRADLGI
jgi:uncharacterized protein (TIGR03085 family)